MVKSIYLTIKLWDLNIKWTDKYKVFKIIYDTAIITMFWTNM